MSVPHIYIVGAQNTGKTTLFERLLQHLEQHPVLGIPPPSTIEETARKVMVAHGYSSKDTRISAEKTMELQHRIVQAQFEAEAVALAHAPWLISDRSAVDAVVYARKYAGTEAAAELAISRELGQMVRRMDEALIVVCEPGADWLDNDGVRLMPIDMDEWIEIHLRFCQLLEELKLEYVVLPCSVESWMTESALSCLAGIQEGAKSRTRSSKIERVVWSRS